VHSGHIGLALNMAMAPTPSQADQSVMCRCERIRVIPRSCGLSEIDEPCTSRVGYGHHAYAHGGGPNVAAYSRAISSLDSKLGLKYCSYTV
jgi:hypothetical protein